MTNPADKAASQKDAAKQPKQTIEAKINSIVDAITRDEKTGQYVLPNDLSDAERFAAIAEKRRRDTQSEFTKERQKAKALEVEKDTLIKRVAKNVTVELTPQQAEELEDLKFSDPEAWRKKKNQYESLAITKQSTEIAEELKQVSTTTLKTEELERRKQVLADFNQKHPDFEISDTIIANDIPPRIVKKLETGAVTFEAFLQECYDYTHKGKVVDIEPPLKKQPNLSRVGGGVRPDPNAIKKDVITTYQTATF